MLFIQIQKVKVDLALAMNGVEKMLQSQQLTFAFVGVAPSLIILFGAVRWLRGMVSTAEGTAHNVKSERRRAWLTMRAVDKILAEKDSDEGKEIRLGHLLIQLQTLRSYAGENGAFPQRDRELRHEFISDIRELERPAELDAKRRVLNRMWVSWADLLGWRNFIR